MAEMDTPDIDREGRVVLMTGADGGLDTDSDAVAHYLDWSVKGKATFVRYTIGLILIALALFLFSGLAALPIMIWSQSVFAGSAAGTVLSTASTFLLLFFLVPVLTRLLLKRPWWSFGFPRRFIDYWGFGVAAVVSFIVGLVSSVVFGALGLLTITYQLPDVGQYVLLAAVSLVGFFVQTSAEEFAFRGYLTQFVRRYTSQPVLFLGFPAVLFAALHISNIASSGGKWYAMLPYLVQALLFGWFAYRTGSLWMSIGLHWSKNVSGSILVGTDIDILPTRAPVVIVNPSIEATTGAILLWTLVTAVVLDLLIQRREKATNRV